MASTATNLEIATLGTRETVVKEKASLVVTAGADTENTLAVVFADAFVNIPEIIGVITLDTAAGKANFFVTDVTTTGMNVKSYQVLAADLASATYVVEVTMVGWKTA